MPFGKQMLDCAEINMGSATEYAVIWLHGLGADGHDFEPIVPELRLPSHLNVRFIFPHAPVIPVTVNKGQRMHSWYDIDNIDLAASSYDEVGMRRAAAQTEMLIARENERGIPSERIILAGFAQGGAVALHTGLRYHQRLLGVLALSAYLPMPETLLGERHHFNRSTPVFMAHGLYDEVVHIRYSRKAVNTVEKLGNPVDRHEYYMPHAVYPEEIQDIRRWMQQRFIDNRC